MSGGYDYASELLRAPASKTTAPSQQPAPQATGSHDYASDLLNRGGDRFSESLNQRIEEEKNTGAASFGGLTKAAVVDDPQTKIRILAKDLFPGDPDAVQRFGMLRGEIVYVGKDDKLYRAEPGGVTGAIKNFGANVAGNALPIAGGTAGAILGAPAGVLGSAGLGALGAAGGKGLQEVIANVGFDEPQTPGGNVAGMAKEAAFAGGGSLAGSVFQKWLGRNMSRDIGRMDTGKVADLDAKAAAQGVDLNVAQRTDLPSLKGRVEALARLPQSADDMNAALEKTRQQASDAADRFLATISPTSGLDEAGTQAREASKNVIAALTGERAAQARPLYRQAFAEFKEFPEALADRLRRLRDSPTFKDAEKVGERLYADDLARMGADELPQAGALRDLHYTKLALDKLIGDEAKGGYAKTSRGAIIGIKDELLKIMDEASPAYKQARGVFAHLSPNIESVKEGVISRIADLTDEQALKASRMMFNPQMSPTAIQRARELFRRGGMEGDWNAMLRGYLQETLEQAGREVKSGPGAGRAVTWRYMMLGDKKQAGNLQASMSQEQWKGFNDMLDVFEAVGRTTGRGNSITMPMTEAASELRKESGSGMIAAALQPRQKIINWLEEARLGKHANKQVEILTSPDGIKRLRELKRMHPNDQKMIQGFTTLFGVSSSPE